MEINYKLTLKRLSALTLLGLLFIIGCSKDDDSSSSSNTPPVSFADFEFSGIFTGTLSNNGNTTPLEGYVTIQENGATTLNLLTGTMTGTSQKNGNSYNITITQSAGIFAGLSNITGSIDTISRVIYLTGTNPDGTTVTVGGDADPVPVMTDGGWSQLTKVAVYFSHNESCKADITINGVTLSGLNGFYEPGGLCAPMYALWNSIPHDVEDEVSTLFCHDVTLQALGGGTVTYTDCNTAGFVLDEGTHYTYTIQWENGETTTGEFTTGMDGQATYICPTNNGPECDGRGLEGNEGNPRFNLQFTGDVDLDLYVRTPSGQVISYTNESADGGVLDVDCTCGGNCNQENIYWQPGTAPAGQYQFWVDYYGGCGAGDPPSNYTIKVLNGSTVLQTKTGTLSGGQSQEYTYTHN